MLFVCLFVVCLFVVQLDDMAITMPGMSRIHYIITAGTTVMKLFLGQHPDVSSFTARTNARNHEGVGIISIDMRE